MPETDSLKALLAEIKKGKEQAAKLKKMQDNVKELQNRVNKAAAEIKKGGKVFSEAEE
jgi:hypothetical protein